MTFVAGFLKAYLPIGWIVAAVLTLWRPGFGRKTLSRITWALLSGVLCGAIVYAIAVSQSMMVEFQTPLSAAVTVTVLCALGASVLKRSQRVRRLSSAGFGVTLFFITAAAASQSFRFAIFVSDQALSATSVLNTEMILNVGAILIGAGIVALVILLTGRVLQAVGMVMIQTFFGVLLLFELINETAEFMLGLMRLQMMEVTPLRLSFVAKGMGFEHLFLYNQVGVWGILLAAFYLHRLRVEASALAVMNTARRRKALGRIRLELRWIKAAAASFFIVLSPLLYYDLYASRPPRISKATPIAPDADGLVRIKIDEVKDGKLHRYAYITSDGTRVRFFLINRYRNGVKIGVVLDACQICGDMGYKQKGNDVICLACNVRMFIPSIGKEGGCNPIPLAHAVQGDSIVISEAELAKGAQNFTEKVTIPVTDPVTGKAMINLKAPQQYDYKGRTFFFESEQSLEQFRSNPEKYLDTQQGGQILN